MASAMRDQENGTPTPAVGARVVPLVPRSGPPQRVGLGSLRRKGLQVAADVLAVALGLGGAYATRGVFGFETGSVRLHVAAGMVSLPFWPLVFARYRLYAARSISSRADEFPRVVHAVLVSILLLVVAAFMGRLPLSRGWLAVAFPMTLVTVGIDRELTRAYFGRLRTQGRLLRPVVIVGGNAEAEALVALLASPALGYDVRGVVADGVPPGPLGGPAGPVVLGGLAEAAAAIETSGATTAIIATTAVPATVANALARDLQRRGIHVEMSSGLSDIASDRLTVRSIGSTPVFYLEPTVHGGWRAVAKRTFDVTLALGALSVLSPVLVVVALGVKLTSKGPVFFSQERVGRGHVVFKVHKFRTMGIDAEQRLADLVSRNEADGPLFKMRDDPRVTRFGRTLRKLSLDELPQLWNVVKGEMSLVGPRPALPTEAEAWGDDAAQRLRVKPGITGMWQVNGRSNASFDEYIRLDLYYVDNWTLTADLTILAKTLPAVAFSKGAY